MDLFCSCNNLVTASTLVVKTITFIYITTPHNYVHVICSWIRMPGAKQHPAYLRCYSESLDYRQTTHCGDNTHGSRRKKLATLFSVCKTKPFP